MFGCVQSRTRLGEQMFGSSVPGEAPRPYFYIFLKMCLLPPSTFVSNKKIGLWGGRVGVVYCCRLVVVSVHWLLKRLDIEKILWYNKFESDIVPLADRYLRSLSLVVAGSFYFAS